MIVEAMKQALGFLRRQEVCMNDDIAGRYADQLSAAITQAEQARWYSVDQMGMATLCRDEADAAETAAENNLMWPRHAPHLATRLVAIDSAAQEAGKGSAVGAQGAQT